jgi:hypothetical protein
MRFPRYEPDPPPPPWWAYLLVLLAAIVMVASFAQPNQWPEEYAAPGYDRWFPRDDPYGNARATRGYGSGRETYHDAWWR